MFRNLFNSSEILNFSSGILIIIKYICIFNKSILTYSIYLIKYIYVLSLNHRLLYKYTWTWTCHIKIQLFISFGAAHMFATKKHTCIIFDIVFGFILHGDERHVINSPPQNIYIFWISEANFFFSFLPYTQIHHSKSMRELHCMLTNICVSAVQPPTHPFEAADFVLTCAVCGNFKKQRRRRRRWRALLT